MSKKHYVAIANILKQKGTDIDTVRALAQVFKADNARFNTDIFMEASTNGCA